jgi:hypothetical protein
MTQRTKTFLDRISLYLERVETDLDECDYATALANCAELAEISRRFWLHIEALLHAQRPQ